MSAKDKKSAIKNTFSYTFEYGEFPLHTDTSFLQLPAKYVILSSFKSIDTSTTIININDFLRDATNEELALIKNSVYLVRTGALTFYTSLMCKANDKFIFRYDPQCMKPMNKAAMEAEELITKFSKVANKTKISWDNPKVLIIDNWQTLHGREALKENKSRTLKRIYIKN
ncbi:TauD/TfdA family dioxygenase [Chryseobacterium sp. NKUCC03_KSP]|uniref:TauD/TfdA family dioxygenase n=1 Tax=Chryseobacterium sp. NKUCC03_KSP TaxID=2842125 RepID=UPI001C5BE30B|nr:TauD/TfdA family dioxygenase [Chryseobacterium sp. NKUCC03_KSP]MBW3524684.1 TauD/TfdA family dioxygenase [Chryseobacterium sp. NKUCC03_KSP]